MLLIPFYWYLADFNIRIFFFKFLAPQKLCLQTQTGLFVVGLQVTVVCNVSGSLQAESMTGPDPPLSAHSQKPSLGSVCRNKGTVEKAWGRPHVTAAQKRSTARFPATGRRTSVRPTHAHFISIRRDPRNANKERFICVQKMCMKKVHSLWQSGFGLMTSCMVEG